MVFFGIWGYVLVFISLNSTSVKTVLVNTQSALLREAVQKQAYMAYKSRLNIKLKFIE